MSKTDSTPAPNAGKSAKPDVGFPLLPHATQRQAKQIRGKLHSFGPWYDPGGAPTKYLDALSARPKPKDEAPARWCSSERPG